jgi:hypothetical protein
MKLPQNPEPDSTLGTLGEFYDLHNLLSNTQRAKCFALPSNMKLQPPYIYLEARILAEEVSYPSSSCPLFMVFSVSLRRKKVALHHRLF